MRRRRISRLNPAKPPPPPIALNALGLPLSPLFDRKWKRKMPLTSIRRLLVPQNGFRFVQDDRGHDGP